MQVDVTPDERDVLLRWKKRSDTLILVRLKAEAILYASRGVDTGIIVEMVDRCERTVKEWLADWRRTGAWQSCFYGAVTRRVASDGS